MTTTTQTKIENFKVILETEKALKIKYPYYEKTSEFDSKHKQKHIILWIPKSVIDVEKFVENKMLENQKLLPAVFRSTIAWYLGFAPKKVEVGFISKPNYGEKMVAHWSDFLDKMELLLGYRIKGIYNLTDKVENCSRVSIKDGKTYDFSEEYQKLATTIPVIIIKKYM